MKWHSRYTNSGASLKMNSLRDASQVSEKVCSKKRLKL